MTFRAELRRKEGEFACVSTPSASTGRPSPRPRPSTARTIVAASSLLSTELDERAVDLDLVEREGPQVGERRIAGAEIVHGDAHAEVLQLAQRGQRAVQVADQRRFGDFEFQPMRREARSAAESRAPDGRNWRWWSCTAETLTATISGLRPRRCLAAGGAQHPFADLQDQPALFGDRDEDVRRDRAAHGCCQRSSASKPRTSPVVDVLLRLIDETQFAAARSRAADRAR